MPQLSMRSAWLVGFVVLSVPYGAFLIVGLANWFHVVDTPLLKAFDEILYVWMTVGPGVAGFVTAVLAPREKFLAGVSLTIAIAVLAVVYNGTRDIFGLGTDFSGLWGAVFVFVATFIFGGIICGLGAFFGAELTE